MKVVGVIGYSGAGKTTLVEALVARFREAGARVSVIKHAHHGFEIDREGKDSWRHRRAGAFEVLVASAHHLAIVRQNETPVEPSVEALLAELGPCDWVLVEGFKRAALPKIEVWRHSTGHPLRYPDDPHVVAVCTDSPQALAPAAGLPVLDLNDPGGVAGFLLAQAPRFAYPGGR